MQTNGFAVLCDELIDPRPPQRTAGRLVLVDILGEVVDGDGICNSLPAAPAACVILLFNLHRPPAERAETVRHRGAWLKDSTDAAVAEIAGELVACGRRNPASESTEWR